MADNRGHGPMPTANREDQLARRYFAGPLNRIEQSGICLNRSAQCIEDNESFIC
jgi:hypothetical protein